MGRMNEAPLMDQVVALDSRQLLHAMLRHEAAMARADEGYGAHPDAGSPEAAFGHDLYLSTAGHGAGFFDRRELGYDLGDKLQDAARRFGEPQPAFYRGWLYL